MKPPQREKQAQTRDLRGDLPQAKFLKLVQLAAHGLHENLQAKKEEDEQVSF